jgi:uncharacterized protein involved in exopolysaccharide biosynthesis
MLAVWSYWRAIALATVLSAIAGFVYSLSPPQYRADLTLRVRASDEVTEATSALSLEITEAFREVVDSLRDLENIRQVFAGIASESAPASAVDFRDKQLSVFPVPGTRFLQVGVTFASAESAIAVANALAARAIAQAGEVERQRLNAKRAAVESRLTIVARQLEETEQHRSKPPDTTSSGHTPAQVTLSAARLELNREAMRATYSKLAQELYELELPPSATADVVRPAATAQSLSPPRSQVVLFAAIAGFIAATLLAGAIVYIRWADSLPLPREGV